MSSKSMRSFKAQGSFFVVGFRDFPRDPADGDGKWNTKD